MGYWARWGLGLALMLAGIGGFAYLIIDLINVGTCASGGPYVSSVPCPENTATKVGLTVPALGLFFVGAWVFISKGGRAPAPTLPDAGPRPASPPIPNFFAQAQQMQAEAMARASASPPAPASAQGNRVGETLTRLEQLAKLRDQGVLTDAEFEAQKAQVLRGT